MGTLLGSGPRRRWATEVVPRVRPSSIPRTGILLLPDRAEVDCEEIHLMAVTKVGIRGVDNRPDFPALERDLLAWWQRDRIVHKYLTRNDASTERYSFLDGPITANNPMGV